MAVAEAEATSLAEMLEEDMAAQSAAQSAARPEAAAAEGTETAAEEPGNEEPGEAGPEAESLSENPILDYYREQFPDDPSAAKYGSDDEFLKGYRHAQKLIGEREQAVEMRRFLEKEGVTARELAGWLQDRKQAAKPGGNGESLADPDYFDPAWVVENDKGEWVATAAAPADVAQRAGRYRAKISAMLRDPSKMAQEVMKHLGPEVKKMISGAQSETAAALAERDDARAMEQFIDRHAAVLFAGGKANADNSNWNPLAHRIAPIAEELSDKRYPTLQSRLERALQIAAAETTPKPNGVKLPAAARHQPAPAAAPARKMTIDEFDEAWPNASIAELMAAFPKGTDQAFSGKAPDRPRAKTK